MTYEDALKKIGINPGDFLTKPDGTVINFNQGYFTAIRKYNFYAWREECLARQAAGVKFDILAGKNKWTAAIQPCSFSLGKEWYRETPNTTKICKAQIVRKSAVSEWIHMGSRDEFGVACERDGYMVIGEIEEFEVTN